jgi:uncharacterized protein YecT (DUF1311 family)
MLRIVLSAVLVSVAGLASASAEEDCALAPNQSAMNICADTAYKSADKDLNAQYAQTRKAVLAYDPEGDKLLITAQRAWVTFRDAHCAASSFAFKGGSMEPFMKGTCLAATTRARTEDLKKMLTDYLH